MHSASTGNRTYSEYHNILEIHILKYSTFQDFSANWGEGYKYLKICIFILNNKTGLKNSPGTSYVIRGIKDYKNTVFTCLHYMLFYFKFEYLGYMSLLGIHWYNIKNYLKNLYIKFFCWI